MKKKIVLAYSGGLDTSVCIRWLVERGWQVVSFMADVGQGEPRLDAIKRAKIAGSSEVVVRDCRQEFANDYILPSLKANAVYEGKYLLGTALSRPLIAKHLVEVAHQKKAQAIGHGCTGKGNDQVRFEVTARALDPKLEIVAPVREWEFKSREEEVDYALKKGIPITVSRKSPYSIDKNLWGLSVEAGPLEDPWSEPPDDSYQWVKKPQSSPSSGASVSVGFHKGIPVSLNGKKMLLVSLIDSLNKLGARHGIGRSDLIESRLVGIKSREVYEAPAATILIEAHTELERIVLDRELFHFKQVLSIRYAELVYYGLWFTPVKKALDELIEGTQGKVNGEVRLKLRQGLCMVTGRRSPNALYKKALATYGKEDKFDQSYAQGFIKLWGLPYEGRGTGCAC